MICAGVVVIDSQFDETQPENFRVEVEGFLRVAGYRGHVVKTEDAFDHDSPCIVRDGITPYRRDEFPNWEGTKYSLFQLQLATLEQD